MKLIPNFIATIIVAILLFNMYPLIAVIWMVWGVLIAIIYLYNKKQKDKDDEFKQKRYHISNEYRSGRDYECFKYYSNDYYYRTRKEQYEKAINDYKMLCEEYGKKFDLKDLD